MADARALSIFMLVEQLEFVVVPEDLLMGRRTFKQPSSEAGNDDNSEIEVVDAADGDAGLAMNPDIPRSMSAHKLCTPTHAHNSCLPTCQHLHSSPPTLLLSALDTAEYSHYLPKTDSVEWICLNELIERMQEDNPPLVLTYNKTKKHYNCFHRHVTTPCPHTAAKCT